MRREKEQIIDNMRKCEGKGENIGMRGRKIRWGHEKKFGIKGRKKRIRFEIAGKGRKRHVAKLSKCLASGQDNVASRSLTQLQARCNTQG